jgi:hypothetical protein
MDLGSERSLYERLLSLKSRSCSSERTTAEGIPHNRKSPPRYFETGFLNYT